MRFIHIPEVKIGDQIKTPLDKINVAKAAGINEDF